MPLKTIINYNWPTLLISFFLIQRNGDEQDEDYWTDWRIGILVGGLVAGVILIVIIIVVVVVVSTNIYSIQILISFSCQCMVSNGETLVKEQICKYELHVYK